MNWSITDSEVTEGNPAVTLELKDDSYSRSMWDYSFQALYKVDSVIVFRLQTYVQ
jgi:glucose-6-phosphate 1-epimerase